MNLAFVFVMAIVIAGCDSNFHEDESLMYARVENASKFSNVVEVKLMATGSCNNLGVELARSTWEGDGFKIVLPEEIDHKYLNTIMIEMQSTIAISNKSVKTMDVAFVGFDKDGIEVTRFSPFGTDKDGNTIDNIYYTYVDDDLAISGYTERMVTIIGTNDYTGPYEWNLTTIYSIEWEKGWNVWCSSSSWDESEATVLRKNSSSPIGNLKWRGDENH